MLSFTFTPSSSLGIEFAIGTYVAIVAFLVAVGGSSRCAKRRPWRRLIVPVIYLLSSLTLLLLARSPFLRYDPIMNPDEAQMAANAILSHYGWLNWNTVDPTTSGSLNSAILAWPYLFGGDITLYSTRLTGLACVFATLVFFSLQCGGCLMAVRPSLLRPHPHFRQLSCSARMRREGLR
jgi:hypothetical protein